MDQHHKQLMVIVNPISGTKSKKRKLRRALEVFRAADLTVDMRHTRHAGHAAQLAAEAARKAYYGVVVCGGDGTVNEAASSLCGSDTALGIIPAGSGNGLARHMEIPVDGKRAARIIARGNIIDCDYATVNSRPFFCTCGAGFDAAVSMRFAKKHKRGLAMYVKSALDEFVSYHPDTYTIIIEGLTVSRQAMMVACCNASQYGNNAFIAPKARITDGLLDLVVVHPRHFISKTAFGLEMMTGFVSRDAKVDIYRCSAATVIRNAPGAAHIDGEPLILPERLDFQCHPRGIKMFVNTSKKPFVPLITPMRMMGRSIAISVSNLFSRK